MPATTKGPDGVIMYELHSRPEQEKFNESAKVKRTEVDERTNKRSSNFSYTCLAGRCACGYLFTSRGMLLLSLLSLAAMHFLAVSL